MAVLTLTTENFDEVIAGEKKVLVDFWAPWCGPCRMVSPIVDEIAEENDSFLVGKVNVDNEGELAARYGVMSIPTLMVFQKGELVNQALGAMPKEKILSLLD